MPPTFSKYMSIPDGATLPSAMIKSRGDLQTCRARADVRLQVCAHFGRHPKTKQTISSICVPYGIGLPLELNGFVCLVINAVIEAKALSDQLTFLGPTGRADDGAAKHMLRHHADHGPDSPCDEPLRTGCFRSMSRITCDQGTNYVNVKIPQSMVSGIPRVLGL